MSNPSTWTYSCYFARTVKYVAKLLMGMVSLCIFGAVQDWQCLIDSLVNVEWGRVALVTTDHATYGAIPHEPLGHS